MQVYYRIKISRGGKVYNLGALAETPSLSAVRVYERLVARFPESAGFRVKVEQTVTNELRVEPTEL